MSELIVVDKYRCPKMDGYYKKENKILVRKGMKVLPSYLERENFENNGVFHVVDKEATENLRSAQDARTAKREAGKRINTIKKYDLIEAIVSNAQGKVVNVSEKEDEEMSLSELRLKYPNIKATSVSSFLEKLEKESQSEVSSERKTSPPVED